MLLLHNDFGILLLIGAKLAIVTQDLTKFIWKPRLCIINTYHMNYQYIPYAYGMYYIVPFVDYVVLLSFAILYQIDPGYILCISSSKARFTSLSIFVQY